MTRLLVVEDDPTIMDLIAILLEREGYGVIRATSAEEGIALAAEQARKLRRQIAKLGREQVRCGHRRSD
jgi:DNA-binding response OmpR family regulator